MQGLEKVKKGLFSRLHDIARSEIFPAAMLNRASDGADMVHGSSSATPAGQAGLGGGTRAGLPPSPPDAPPSSERKLFKAGIEKQMASMDQKDHRPSS